jgi:hypothetical protein
VLVHLGIAYQGRERIHEAKEPSPEHRVGHGLAEQAIAPPRQVEELCPGVPFVNSQHAGQALDLALGILALGILARCSVERRPVTEAFARHHPRT